MHYQFMIMVLLSFGQNMQSNPHGGLLFTKKNFRQPIPEIFGNIQKIKILVLQFFKEVKFLGLPRPITPLPLESPTLGPKDKKNSVVDPYRFNVRISFISAYASLELAWHTPHSYESITIKKRRPTGYDEGGER